MFEPEKLVYSQLYRATLQQLTTFRERVAECKDLDAANDFARYVLNSGMVKLLAPLDNNSYNKIDSAFLRWTAEELRKEVCEKFRGGKSSSHVDRSCLEAINHKLDLIAGAIARQ